MMSYVLSHKRQVVTFAVSVVLSVMLVSMMAFGATTIDTASVGVGTSTPGGALGVKGAGVFDGFVHFDYFTSTSTANSWLLGKLGVGTTTPGDELGVTGAGLVEGGLTTSYLNSTSTVASSFGGSLGIGTSTPAAELGLAGDIMQSSSATTTILVESTTADTGGCIELMHSNGGVMWRIYIGAGSNADTEADGLVVEAGKCQ